MHVLDEEHKGVMDTILVLRQLFDCEAAAREGQDRAGYSCGQLPSKVLQ